LAADYLKDQDAARAKYAGKKIEVTGRFDSYFKLFGPLDTGKVDLVLRGDKPHQKADEAEKVFCPFTGEQFKKDPRISALSRQQSVTVRGKAHDFTVTMLENCELVAVGPSTAIPTTLSEIESVLNTKDGPKRFEGKDLLVRVTLKGAKPTANSFVGWSVVAPMGSSKEFFLELPFANRACLEELLEPNPKDTIVVLAELPEPSPDTRAISLKETRLVKTIPADLKLPDEKK
jgi:hypothetical protein